ncbi:hypothetical protein FRC03_010178 [Tulasnella sp. 419]|nr:hypothetical protein FRC03_010178 [Tulasnella sp. 419]
MPSMKFLHRRGHSLNHLDGNSATSSPAPSVISLSSTVNETSKYPVTEVPACVQLPWHAVFPAPRSTPAYATAADLASMVRNLTAGKDYVIVDVRRADFEDAFIKGAVNFPAHSFYPTIQSIGHILSHIPIVVFHCNSCSEGGRGPRTAGWYADELERRGLDKSGVFILSGGIKGWIRQFGEDSALTVMLPKQDD